MRFAALSLRLIVPAVWLGLIIAIDLIEAPLKFQAPGITIPLGLGIGRLVFTAMNITEAVLLLVLALSLFGTRTLRPAWAWLIGIAAVYLTKVAIVRPMLNARTEAVLAGQSAPFGAAHMIYIFLDAVLFILLVGFTLIQSRALLSPVHSTVMPALGTQRSPAAAEAPVAGVPSAGAQPGDGPADESQPHGR